MKLEKMKITQNTLIIPQKKSDNPGIRFLKFNVGFYDSNKKFIECMSLKRSKREPEIAPYQDCTEFLEGEYFYGGLVFNHFGHFLLETLSRLHLIKKTSSKIIFVANKNFTKFNNWQIEIFRILDINLDSILVINKPKIIRNLIISNPGCELGNYFHEELVKSFGNYESNPIIGNKVWISRSRLDKSKSKVINEFELESILLSHGWIIFHPQENSIEEQINIYRSASVICGFEGSAFYTLIFIKNIVSKVVIIKRGPGEIEKIGKYKKIEKNYYTIMNGLKINPITIQMNLEILDDRNRKSIYKISNIELFSRKLLEITNQ